MSGLGRKQTENASPCPAGLQTGTRAANGQEQTVNGSANRMDA